MKHRILALITAGLLVIGGCSGGSQPDAAVTPAPTPTPTSAAVPTPSMQPTPEPTPTPYSGPVNPLTGLPVQAEISADRPVAIMLNNLKQAMPQLGVSQADIIYEMLAEGGITRMLALYQSVEDVGKIGSVRSARTYYVELAAGHDAVFLHAGGSPDAYDKIKAWGVTALDCVNGPYEGSLFWRDKDRIQKNGHVHSVVTSGDTIQELFPKYSFRQEHSEGYTYEMSFAEDGTPAGGESAQTVTVPFSSIKTGVFRYDEENGVYLAEQYGQSYIDGNTGEQVKIVNVLVLKTDCPEIPGDTEGRITVDLTGGEGWYACGGKYIPILWEKDGVNGHLVYKTADGELLTLGAGNSYVNIVPLESKVAFE